MCFHWYPRPSMHTPTDVYWLPPTSTDFRGLPHKRSFISTYFHRLCVASTVFHPVVARLPRASRSSLIDSHWLPRSLAFVLVGGSFWNEFALSMDAGATSMEADRLPNTVDVDLPPWTLVGACDELDGSRWKYLEASTEVDRRCASMGVDGSRYTSMETDGSV